MTPHTAAPDLAPPDAAARRAREIALRAHLISLRRSSTDDRQRQDWLDAEAELDREAATDGQLAAVRVRHDQLTAERDEIAQQLVAEHEVGRILAGAADITDAAPAVLQALGTALGWDACIFWQPDPKAKLLRCLAVWHAAGLPLAAFEAEARLRTFSAGSDLPGRVWAGGAHVWTPDAAADPDGPWGAFAAQCGLRGIVGVPVRGEGDSLAVVECFSRTARAPNDQLAAVMNNIGGQIGLFIERRAAERRLRDQAQDRRVGREIQRGLLPKVTPRLPGFTLGGRSLAPNDVGGDCFDFIPLPGAGANSTGVLVADASGHGIGAALMVSETRAYLRGVALTTADVGTLFDLTNKCLATDPLSGAFVSAVLVRLDPATRSLSYAGAGHPPGYVFGADGRVRLTLDSAGGLLGVVPQATFPAATVALEPGDLVLLVTDGIMEAAPRDGKAFGAERMLELVGRHRHRPPEEIVTALFVAVVDHCADNCVDDLTAVVIKVD